MLTSKRNWTVYAGGRGFEMKKKSKRIPPLLNVDIGLVDVAERVDACESKEPSHTTGKAIGRDTKIRRVPKYRCGRCGTDGGDWIRMRRKDLTHYSQCAVHLCNQNLEGRCNHHFEEPFHIIRLPKTLLSR